MEQIIESLQKLGLTRYEAKAYIGLTNLIEAQANDIAEASEIPRSKIYNTLKELNKKGFVTITKTRPIEYKVVSPKNIVNKKKKELMREIDESEEKLEEIFNSQISEVQAPIWLIKTSDNIISKEIEIIKRARKSLNMRIGFLLEGEGEALIKAFNTIPRNIPIRILASPYCYIDQKRIDIIEMFENAGLENLEIIKADIPFVKIIIRDEKELFRTIVKFTGKEKSVLEETAVGVLNQYSDICKNFDERFVNQFNRIKQHKKSMN